MKRNALIQFACVTALLLTAAWANAARSTNGTNPFNLISQKNIFNGHRQILIEPQPRVEHFSLNGTMSCDDTAYAFFDGDSRRFQNRTLKPGQAIGGFVVVGIANDSATLRAPDGHAVKLEVGAKLAALAPNISGESK